MTKSPRIYLDNAATSWPKPEEVYTAVDDYQRNIGAPAGRSAYAEAVQVERAVADARGAVARLLEIDDAKRVVFTANGTDSLNQAIHGLVRPGDHVVTSVAEHNSVLRPLCFLEQHAKVEVTRVSCSDDGVVAPDDVRAALRPDTRLVALIHASNVTGALQPVAEIGSLLSDHAALFLIDAAQSLGHLPIAFDALGCDLLAAPGHKGLLGPLGTGVLALAPGVEQSMLPVRQGGTGTRSEEDTQPETLPDRYESGNHNVPGILGLAAGVKYLQERGIQAVWEHEQVLSARLWAGLAAIDKVKLFGPSAEDQRVGVVSISVEGYDPQEVAAMLDSAYRIQVRAGIHCAPLMHRALGTLDQGGTIRFSLGAFSSQEQIDAAIAAVQQITSTTLAN